MAAKKKEQSKEPCAKCGKSVPVPDNFCSGCKNVICESCGDAPWGPHRLADHTPPCRICGERVEAEGDDHCASCEGGD